MPGAITGLVHIEKKRKQLTTLGLAQFLNLLLYLIFFAFFSSFLFWINKTISLSLTSLSLPPDRITLRFLLSVQPDVSWVFPTPITNPPPPLQWQKPLHGVLLESNIRQQAGSNPQPRNCQARALCTTKTNLFIFLALCTIRKILSISLNY